MFYVDIIICIGSLPILEIWPPIYRGQERTVRDRLRENQVYSYVYFQYAPCVTEFTFEIIRRPTLPILSPSSRTFVGLTLVMYIEEHPPPMHDGEVTEESGQPSNIGEFLYQQPYYDHAPSASSSREPGYDLANDDPPSCGNYRRWN
jgi:hypothetical protein